MTQHDLGHACQHSTFLPVLLVIHHLRCPFLGHAEAPLRAAGLTLDERFLRRGDGLPATADVGGVLVFGGEQSAVRTDADPLLAGEAAFLREAVAAGLPVLGICLGGQLLSHALGGSVRRVGRVIEWRDLSRTGPGASDPLFGGLPDPFPALHFNEDVFDAPPGAQVLATPAPAGAAAFRAGERAWGLQYHPDATADVLERWFDDYRAEIADEAALRAESAARADAQAHTSSLLFGAFAKMVAHG